jgi:sugar O-acyltransferase (sialic acid O-acetyltransferase NeuD family)
MSKELILLVGAGGHARASIDVIEQEGRFALKGLVGHAQEVGTQIFNYPVLGTDADLPALLSYCKNALVAVGHIKTPEPRIRLFDLLQLNESVMPVIVSPHASLGAGTIVMHGAIISAGAVVGKNCIINNRSLIEHEAIVASHCHISTGAIINGNANIGLGSFVGSGSIIKQGVRLGSGCVVDMGIAVRHHYSENSLILTDDES